MFASHSNHDEKSAFDVQLHRESTDRDDLPAELAWLCSDRLTWEIKADAKAVQTGNLFFETERVGDGDTGLRCTQSDRWAHAVGRTVFCFASERLLTGVDQLLASGQTRELAGGDGNFTRGAAIAAGDCLRSPLAGGEPPARPVVYQITFDSQSLSAQALHGPTPVGLKTDDEVMNWHVDLAYGEHGERYVAALLCDLADPKTIIAPVVDCVQVAYQPQVPGHAHELRLAYRKNGTPVGLAELNSDAVLIQFAEVQLLLPTAALLDSARCAVRVGRKRVNLHGEELATLTFKQLLADVGCALPGNLPALAPAPVLA